MCGEGVESCFVRAGAQRIMPSCKKLALAKCMGALNRFLVNEK